MRVADIEGLRPTSSRAREALFNILGDIQDGSVLDLFAGSGVIGLEAISRGANQVESFEANTKACQAMRQIKEAWDIEHWQVHLGNLPACLPEKKHFDVVFADPPYASGLADQVPAWLAKKGITYGDLVVEESSRTKMKWKQGAIPSQARKYGETTLYFFKSDEAFNA